MENIEEDCKMLNPEDDAFFPQSKSSVKLKKTSRGVTWEIKCVEGEAHLLEGLMMKAIEVHKKIEKEVGN